MIIIGYQGIGKSTIAKSKKIYIDLESSIYYHDGLRPEKWYIFYCKTAEYLSKQGYVVFISSHKEVREYLLNSKERIIIICPDKCLKDAWISKLENRYNHTLKDKDFRAWKNAEQRYTENIDELMNSGLPLITIGNMEYDLKLLIEGAIIL